MDWTPVAELIRDNPAAPIVVGSAVAAVLVQAYKKFRRLAPADDALRKRLAAALAAVVIAGATEWLAGGLDVPRLIAVGLGVYLGASGVHSNLLRSNGAQSN